MNLIIIFFAIFVIRMAPLSSFFFLFFFRLSRENKRNQRSIDKRVEANDAHSIKQSASWSPLKIYFFNISFLYFFFRSFRSIVNGSVMNMHLTIDNVIRKERKEPKRIKDKERELKWTIWSDQNNIFSPLFHIFFMCYKLNTWFFLEDGICGFSRLWKFWLQSFNFIKFSISATD